MNNIQVESFGGRIGLHLTDDCFYNGQLLVGLSNTTDPKPVPVLSHKYATVRNVVCNQEFLKWSLSSTMLSHFMT